MKTFIFVCLVLMNLTSWISARNLMSAPPVGPVSVPAGTSEYNDFAVAFKKVWPNYLQTQGTLPADPLPITKLPSANCGGLPVYVLNFGELKVSAASPAQKVGPKDAGGGWIGSGGPLKLIVGLDSKQKTLSELYSDHFQDLAQNSGGAVSTPTECPDLAVTVKSTAGSQKKVLHFDMIQKKYKLKDN